jgi:2-iminoacetate synthase ThiH
MTASPIQHIKDKFFKGERLSYEDGVTLYSSNDLFALADMANHTRNQKFYQPDFAAP